MFFCFGILVIYDCEFWGGFKSFIEERGCYVVLRSNNNCDLIDIVCIGDIVEVRKMGYEGIIRFVGFVFRFVLCIV